VQIRLRRRPSQVLRGSRAPARVTVFVRFSRRAVLQKDQSPANSNGFCAPGLLPAPCRFRSAQKPLPPARAEGRHVRSYTHNAQKPLLSRPLVLQQKPVSLVPGNRNRDVTRLHNSSTISVTSINEAPGGLWRSARTKTVTPGLPVARAQKPLPCRAADISQKPLPCQVLIEKSAQRHSSPAPFDLSRVFARHPKPLRT